MIIEPDQYYYEDGVYRWSPEKREAAWEDCYRRLTAALAEGGIRKVVILVGIPGSGKSTFAQAHDEPDVAIFDALFVDPIRRPKVVAAARAASVPIEAIWFDLPWELCFERNAARSPDRRIPEDALRQMKQHLDAAPPSLEEGFAAVHRVVNSD